MSERRISVVVEWDNVRLAGESRARAMLEGLADELRADGRRSAEVLLVHDGRPGDVAEAKGLLAPTGADVRVVEAPGCDYYELKNAGAQAARGDLVVFLDCDVVPEPGWLGAVVSTFDDPEVAVVAGATRVEKPTGLWSKCVAPTLVFPLTNRPGPVERVDRFFANNVAFRRDTALAYPFPSVAGASRVACVVLAEQLRAADIAVVRNPAARARHPVPLGFRATVKRAVVHGRDTVVLSQAGIRPPATARAWVTRVAELVRGVVRDRRTVGLRPLAVPLGVAVAIAYYACVAAGGALARLAPAKARSLEL